MLPELEALLSEDLGTLMKRAATIRDEAFGNRVTFSKKVFIPLTHLCRDNCGYCTFVHPPKKGEAPYLSPEQVLKIARAGQAAGCAEALFTLGDKPELKWKPAAEALEAMGYRTTLEYLAAMGDLVFRETGLLPHFNPGLMDAADLAKLRKSSVSMGIMLETTAERLSERGGPHFGAPDKVPALRLATLKAAGQAKVPFTSGILIGIGETRAERIEALVALRDLHRAHGHLQEVIIQNFRAKPDTRMAGAPEPSFDELLWTVAVARLIFGDTLSVQAPPNLQEPGYGRLIEAGIDDWGGVSPVTPDHVNPERPWPQLDALAAESARYGKVLTERLAVYPRYIFDKGWIDAALRPRALAMSNASGLRRDNDWRPGLVMAMPALDVATLARPSVRPSASLAPIIDRAVRGDDLSEGNIVRLFEARGPDFAAVTQAADALRKDVVGDTISYAVVRNINYTNICYFRCRFCASPPTCAALPMTSPCRKSCVARRKHGTAAPPKSACRAASIRSIPANTISTSARRCARRSRACTSTPSRRSRSGTAPRPSACRFQTISRSCATRASAACPAPRPKCSTTRCVTSSAPTRSRRTSG